MYVARCKQPDVLRVANEMGFLGGLAQDVVVSGRSGELLGIQRRKAAFRAGIDLADD